MATTYEIKIMPAMQQTFSVSLGDIYYNMRLLWADIEEGGWTLDIMDNAFTPIIMGIPLITGADLLEQYRVEDIGGGGYLFVVTDGEPYAVPTKENLGINSHLIWQPYG